jgi:hypothetical protein
MARGQKRGCDVRVKSILYKEIDGQAIKFVQDGSGRRNCHVEFWKDYSCNSKIQHEITLKAHFGVCQRYFLL